MRSLIILLISILCFTISLNSQWQPDLRLTYDASESATSLNYARCIASCQDTLHVVWYDGRNGVSQFYYKRSIDGGITWGADTRLSNSTSYAERGGIAVSGQTVHVVWQDWRNPSWEIYYKRSMDGGLSWGPDTRLTNADGNSWAPCVFVSGLMVNVCWTETRDGNVEVYYKRSPDGGISWGQDIRLTNDTAQSWYPSIAVSGLIVHVFWSDLRNNNYEIYYKRSADGGISWGPDTRLTNHVLSSQNPSAYADSSFVHMVWWDERDGNWEIYYKRSSDGGFTWSSDTRLTNASGISALPGITSSGNLLHVIWEDDRDGNNEIYYKRSTNGGLLWEPDTRLTIFPGESHYPSISCSGSKVHAVWFDERDGNREIYYKRNPTSNVYLGVIYITGEIPEEYSLLQNYPNPFNPETKIKFQIPKSGFVNISVYDILGRNIESLVNENLNPGTYEVNWNTSSYPSGVYYYKINAGDYSETRKMILLK